MGEFKFFNPGYELQPEKENESDEVLNLRREIKDGIEELAQVVEDGRESLYIQKLNAANKITDEEEKMQALNIIHDTLQADLKHYRAKNAV